MEKWTSGTDIENAKKAHASANDASSDHDVATGESASRSSDAVDVVVSVVDDVDVEAPTSDGSNSCGGTNTCADAITGKVEMKDRDGNDQSRDWTAKKEAK